MNKKRILAFICAILTFAVCSVAGMLVYAENEGDGDEADYTVCFVHEGVEYPLTKSGDKYTYESETLSAKTLYRIEIKDKNGDKAASALLYKNGEGKVDVSYEDSKIKIAGDSGDIYDNAFDFEANPYYVSVTGGIIKSDISGLFAGRELSSFYFAENAEITVEAIHDQDQCVAEWKNNIDEDYGKQTQIRVIATGSEKNIELEAVIDYLSIDKLLEKSTSITLKKNYENIDTVTLNGENTYTINLNGFNIKTSKQNGAFEIDGATVIFEGEGKIESTIDQNGAICLKSGSLTLDGQTVIGKNGALKASGGELTINGGSFDGENYGAILTGGSGVVVTINGGSFNELLNTDVALSVQGGAITINGGSFYGADAIKSYVTEPNIKITAGLFVSDNFESVIKNYIDELSIFSGDSTQGYTVTPRDPRYTITINDGVLSNGYSTWEYEAGVTVVVKPVENTDGMVFERWEILDGDIAVSDLTAKEISFVMPAGSVVLNAIFKPDSTVDTGSIGGSDTTQSSDTAGSGVVGATTTSKDGADTTQKKSDSADGSMAIIVLIIILIALLIAAIAVSIILIVRNYRAEREAIERAELGESVVDSLADSLAVFGFGASVASEEQDGEEAPQVKESQGIDFDKEIDLSLNDTIIGFDSFEKAEEKHSKGEMRIRRPIKPAQRPSRMPNTHKDE